MKREVERKQQLPAYSLTVAQLEVLIERLRVLFPEPEETRCHVDIKLKSEKLTFDSVEELKSYSLLRGRITDFSIWVSNSPRRIWISTAGLLFDSRSTVHAEGESEAWCAGAIETVQSFVETRKLWYHWFLSAPIGWLLVAVTYLPLLYFSFLPKGTVVEKTVVAGWVGAMLTLFLLWLGRGRLLPGAILRVTEEEGFLRRRAPELTLLIALASATLTIAGWFVGK